MIAVAKVRVVVGSAAAIKLDAARAAFAACGIDADVIGVKAASGIPEQPVGHDETKKGARNRALFARTVAPTPAIAIGIENGIVYEHDEWWDVAWIVLLRPNGEERWVPTSYVKMPFELVEDALARDNRSVTVGSLIHRRHGGDPQDPHAVVTNGAADRKTLLTEAITAALMPLQPSKEESP